MNTIDKRIQTEVDGLNGDILVSESVVSGSRDKYVSELCANDGISRMMIQSRIGNKTYKKPKRVKRNAWLSEMFYKIKILFGFEK